MQPTSPKSVIGLFIIVQAFFIILSCSSYAQNIKGIVHTANGKPVVAATVELLRYSDSLKQRSRMTDSTGSYEFAALQQGKYRIRVSFVGNKTYVTDGISISGSQTIMVPTIALQSNNENTLKDVVVEAKKPLFEMRADKLVMNVQNNINAIGNDGIELLSKAPGIEVDRDDNISMNGKNGVAVYIDGRLSPLTGSALASYLRSLQSSQIEAVEFITNPSSKFDAAGTGGIINIKLIREKNLGTNGSINAGYGIGVYSKYNAGLALNHRTKKSNLFGNISYANNINENTMDVQRSLLDTFFSQQSATRKHNAPLNIRAGIDFFLSKASTLGFLVNTNWQPGTEITSSQTAIVYVPTEKTDRMLEATNNNELSRNNYSFNTNYKYSAKGKDLNFDLDLSQFRNRSDQLQSNYYYNPLTGAQTSSRIYHMLTPVDITMYSLKGDYEQDAAGGKLGFGFKTSYVTSESSFGRYDVVPPVEYRDSLRSNDFSYKENINALYVNYNRQFKAFLLQAGVRMENSNITGTSTGYTWQGKYIPYDSTFTRNYTNFFPAFAASFNQNKNSQFGFAYSYRIQRPGYEDLNPFENKIDEYTYYKGNTQLRPQYTHSMSLSHLLNNSFSTKLSYDHVDDVITRIVDTTERTKSFLTKQNLATQDIVNLSLSYNFEIKWYSAIANLNAYYSHFKADFGQGRKIDLAVRTVNADFRQSARIGKTSRISADLFYRSKSIWSGTFTQQPYWWLDLGFQKEILQKNGVLRLSVTDVFKTIKFDGYSDFAGQKLNSLYLWESRQFKCSFNWRFGNKNVKDARKRETGIEDEKKRVAPANQ